MFYGVYPYLGNGIYGQFVNFNIPEGFRKAVSYEDQIHWLVHHIAELYDTQGTWVTETQLALDQARQDAEWQIKLDAVAKTAQVNLDLAVEQLMKLIRELTGGSVAIEDPTYGRAPVPIQDAVWRMYDFLRFFSLDVDQIEELEWTVDEWDEMMPEVKIFDLYSVLYFDESSLPTPTPPGSEVTRPIKLTDFIQEG